MISLYQLCQNFALFSFPCFQSHEHTERQHSQASSFVLFVYYQLRTIYSNLK